MARRPPKISSPAPNGRTTTRDFQRNRPRTANLVQYFSPSFVRTRIDEHPRPSRQRAAAPFELLPASPDAPPTATVAGASTSVAVPPPLTPGPVAPITDPYYVSGRQWSLTRGRWLPGITGFPSRP